MAASTRHIEPLLPDPSVNSQPHLFIGDRLHALRRNLPATILWSPLKFTAEAGAALGLAVETDTGLARAGTKTVVLGLASETDTSFAVTRTKSRTVGIATETDIGLSLSSAEGELLGLASETDTGLAVTRTKVVTFGVGIETDSGLPMVGQVPAAPAVTQGGGSAPSRETQDYWERERQRLAAPAPLDDDEVLLLL